MIVLLQFVSNDPEIADKVWNLLDEHCQDYGIPVPERFFVDGIQFTPPVVSNG